MLPEIKYLSISFEGKDLTAAVYEIKTNDKNYYVKYNGTQFMLNGEPIERDVLVQWLKENGYDTQTLYQMEYDAFMENFKSLLYQDQYYGGIDLDEEAILTIEEKGWYFRAAIYVKDTDKLFENYYFISLSAALEDEPNLVALNTKDLAVYWYGLFGFELEEEEPDGTLVFVNTNIDKIEKSDIRVEIETDVIDFVPIEIKDYWDCYLPETFDVFIEGLDLFRCSTLEVMLHSKKVVSSFDLLLLSPELLGAEKWNLLLEQLYPNYVQYLEGLQEHSHYYYISFDYDYDDAVEFVLKILRQEGGDL